MEVARLHHDDLGMNTEYFRALHLLCIFSDRIPIFSGACRSGDQMVQPRGR